MEFYNRLMNNSPSYLQSFNSQRDGILHMWKIEICIFKPFVSIPNGMEFYGSFSAKIHKAKASFNSQRDGILL